MLSQLIGQFFSSNNQTLKNLGQSADLNWSQHATQTSCNQAITLRRKLNFKHWIAFVKFIVFQWDVKTTIDFWINMQCKPDKSQGKIVHEKSIQSTSGTSSSTVGSSSRCCDSSSPSAASWLAGLPKSSTSAAGGSEDSAAAASGVVFTPPSEWTGQKMQQTESGINATNWKSHKSTATQRHLQQTSIALSMQP